MIKKISKVVLIGVILVISIWDFIALLVGGEPSTISAVIGEWTDGSSAIPFVAGFVAAHLFWPRGKNG